LNEFFNTIFFISEEFVENAGFSYKHNQVSNNDEGIHMENNFLLFQ